MTRKHLWIAFCFVLFFVAACEKAPELTLTSSSSIELDVNGSSDSFSFSANRDWSVSTTDSWVTVSPASGKASDGPVTVRVTVRCEANTTYDDRTATLSIRMEDLSQAVTVRQPANKGIVLPTQAYDLQSSAKTIEVTVQANVDYTVETSVDWIKQIGTKGLTSRTLNFSIEENTTYDAREGKITIKPTQAGVAEQVISVKQAQKDALIVEKTSYDMPYGGGEVEIKVEANVAFIVTPDSEWLHHVSTKALSSSTVLIKVDENATYSAREGKIEIAQQNGSLKHTITIKQAGRIAVTSIELDQPQLFIEPGKTASLTATVKPDNATDKKVIWRSSNTSVAKVDKAGVVMAIEEGSAVITAKAGDKTAECVVTVCIPVSSIELDKTELALKPGGIALLTATVMPDNATDKTVTWSTSNASVATVDDSGIVTMVKEGEATITAKAGDKTAECKVTVFVPVTSIELDKTELSLVLGETATLMATVKPDNATDKTVRWYSSNPNVATVDGTGKVTMIKEGDAIISASAGDMTAECKVTICIPVSTIELNISELTLDPGETSILKAVVMPDNATDKTVTWSSSDPTVATVYYGRVNALKEGSAIITAKAGDKTTTCSLTVVYIVPDDTVDLGIIIRQEDGTAYRLFWAKCNIGASKPEENGDYYAWGEIKTKEKYSLSTYKWWNEDEDKPTKYIYFVNRSTSVLAPGDDVAHVKLGGKWRTPTYDEWEALSNTRKNTEEYTWIWCDGSTEKYEGTTVEGWKIVRNATSATLFLPAVGYGLNYTISNRNSTGYYWSSTLQSNPKEAACLFFDSNKVRVRGFPRYYGLPVRPVLE